MRANGEEVHWEFGDLPTREETERSVSFAPGSELDGYVLLEQIGRGGGGTVFRARDPLGREVALKLMREDLGPRGLKRFRREGELLARLCRPGVLRVHAAGTLGTRPYLVTEFVEGARDAEAYLAGRGREERIAFLLEVADALAAVHEQGIVHRDLKPSNILVDPAGRPHIADFGLALAPDHTRMSRTEEFVGTPLSMAPEQWKDSAAVGPHTDVWALGVLLYWALCDRYPFAGATLAEQFARVTSGPLDPPGAGAALDAVCMRALARDPKERYADAAAFARALRQAQDADQGASARTKLRLVVALCGTALTTAAAGLVATALRAGAPAPEEAPLAPARTAGGSSPPAPHDPPANGPPRSAPAPPATAAPPSASGPSASPMSPAEAKQLLARALAEDPAALRRLEAAANAGQATACRAWGKLLLSRQPLSPERGEAWLLRAASLGSLAAARDLTAQGGWHRTALRALRKRRPEAEVHDAASEFSAEQGKFGWTYLSGPELRSWGALNEGALPFLRWDSRRRAWQGEDPYQLIFREAMHPGEHARVVRRWTAPAAGSVLLSAKLERLDNQVLGEQVVVRVRCARVLLYERALLGGRAEELELATRVEEGDPIDFEVLAGADSNDRDTTRLAPTILFFPGERLAPPPRPRQVVCRLSQDLCARPGHRGWTVRAGGEPLAWDAVLGAWCRPGVVRVHSKYAVLAPRASCTVRWVAPAAGPLRWRLAAAVGKEDRGRFRLTLRSAGKRHWEARVGRGETVRSAPPALPWREGQPLELELAREDTRDGDSALHLSFALSLGEP